MAKTSQGADLQSASLAATSGYSGTATATSATSLTDSAASGWSATSGAAITGVAGNFAGKIVVAGTVWATILSNTTTVLTVDSWKTLSSTGAIATGTTPGNIAYQILPGGSPAFYMGLTTDTTAVTGSETSLTSELTTAGLGRALATYAHTSGTTSYTLQKQFTYTGSSSVAVAKAGIFNASSGGVMMFVTLLASTATVTANGDTLTVTETVTLS
jgi:hypothetical protein